MVIQSRCKRSTDGRRADLAAGAWMAYTPDFQGVFDGTAELPLGQDLRVLAQGEQFALEDLKDGMRTVSST